MPTPIICRLIRGRLYFPTVDVLVSTFVRPDRGGAGQRIASGFGQSMRLRTRRAEVLTGACGRIVDAVVLIAVRGIERAEVLEGALRECVAE